MTKYSRFDIGNDQFIMSIRHSHNLTKTLEKPIFGPIIVTLWVIRIIKVS